MQKPIKYMLFLVLIPLLGGIGCRAPADIGSAPFQIRRQRAKKGEHVPVVQGQITVLFRDVPSPGAVESFMDGLAGMLDQISPMGAVTSIFTGHERMFSRLEQGKRRQVTFSYLADVPKGYRFEKEISFDRIEQAAKQVSGENDRIPPVIDVRGVSVSVVLEPAQ